MHNQLVAWWAVWWALIREMPPIITWIVVLGDIDRSPRMRYHADSLASKSDSIVHVIAYGGTSSTFVSAPNVRIAALPEVPTWILRLPGLLRLALKVVHQLLAMLWIMMVQLPSPSNILMQNPPAIPTMMLCWLAARRHGASLVIDWHNFGHSIMALKHDTRGSLVRLARSHEAAWGRAADKSFCVTRAMQQELAGEEWRVRATVLYDRPPRRFCRSDAATAHELLGRLSAALADAVPNSSAADFAVRESSEWSGGFTVATRIKPGSGPRQKAAAEWRQDRPAIVVSSTSWTPDEDFGVLLEALVLYESAIAEEKKSFNQQRQRHEADDALPQLLVLITGRGPQREMYLRRVAQLGMRHVAVSVCSHSDLFLYLFITSVSELLPI